MRWQFAEGWEIDRPWSQGNIYIVGASILEAYEWGGDKSCAAALWSISEGVGVVFNVPNTGHCRRGLLGCGESPDANNNVVVRGHIDPIE